MDSGQASMFLGWGCLVISAIAVFGGWYWYIAKRGRRPDVKRLAEKGDVRGLAKAAGRDDSASRAAVEELVKLGPQAVGPLIWQLGKLRLYLSSPGSTYHGEVEALAGVGSPAVDPLIAALDHRKSEVRYGAALALGKIGDGRAVEPLVGRLSREWEKVRDAMLFALAEIPDERALAALVDYIRENTHDGSAAAAAKALGAAGNQRAASPLATLLREVRAKRSSEPSEAHRYGSRESAIIYALEQLGHKPAVEPATTPVAAEWRAPYYGGFGEPYCSQACYKRGAAYAMATVDRPVCSLCGQQITPAADGHRNYGVVPSGGKALVVGECCAARARERFRSYRQCSICGKGG